MPRVDLSHIKTHTIRGRKFRMVWRKPRDTKKEVVHADCESPSHEAARVAPGMPVMRIGINHVKDPLKILEHIIHEVTHGALYDLDEDAVTGFTDSLMSLLRRAKVKVTFGKR